MNNTFWWLFLAAACSNSAVKGSDSVGDPAVAEPEMCDGLDNDGNGVIDDAASDAVTWYADADGDGHGDAAAPVAACDAPAGTVAAGDDCDDASADIHPGAAEACNGADDDCDGAVDGADPDAADGCGAADTGGGTGDTDAGDSGSGGSGMPAYPSAVLDLTNWKLTLPLAGDGGGPLEIEQPELDTYTNAPYFQVSGAGDAVVFHANAGGVTTSGSHYPRAELREMTDGGATKASWSMTSGVHTMTVTEAITHLPDVKQHIVAGQIHDANDDVVMIRLEGSRLFVEGGGNDLGVLNAAYTLGDEFTIRIVASDGTIDVYYDDMSAPKVSVQRDNTGCYFKAGAYTQSNPDRGDSPDAYGEVEIHALSVSHE